MLLNVAQHLVVNVDVNYGVNCEIHDIHRFTILKMNENNIIMTLIDHNFISFAYIKLIDRFTSALLIFDLKSIQYRNIY